MCTETLHDPRDDGRPPTVVDLLEDISQILNWARFYGPDHHKVTEAIGKAEKTLHLLFAANERRPIEIGYADGYLFCEQRPILGLPPGADRIRPVIETLGAGGLHFAAETNAIDLRALVRLALHRDLSTLGLEGGNAQLESEGALGLKLLGTYAVGEGPTDLASRTLGTRTHDAHSVRPLQTVVVPARLYDHLFDYLTETMTALFSDKLFLIEDTKDQISLVLDQLNEDAFPLMDAAAKRTSRADPYLFRHSIRVSCVALNVARCLTEDRQVLLRIGAAALLHDVGKRFVPLDVLYHQGPLDADMRLAMQEHPAHGARLLMQLEDADPLTIAACAGHHWPRIGQGDASGLPTAGSHAAGGGYPRVEYDVRLSPATRLIKLCDVYEALTAKRPYKPPMSPRRAYRIMMDMEAHFDRSLLHRFILANGVWPVGHRVRLESDAVAKVMAQTDDLDRPIVQIEDDEEHLDLREARHAGHGAVIGFEHGEDGTDPTPVESAAATRSR